MTLPSARLQQTQPQQECPANPDTPHQSNVVHTSRSHYPGRMSRLDYVIWYVESLWRSTEFYRDMLGLAVRIDGDGYVEFALDNIKLALFERAKLPELIGQEHGTAPCGEIGFIVTDVDAEAARLQQAGADIRSGPTDRPWGERTLHIADPDGNIVEFAQKIR